MATFSEYTKNRKKKKEDEYTKGQSFADYTATALSDNDIAPVKEELTEKEKKAGGWFDSGAFSDGYQLGDISKTILGTLTDINENVTEAVLDATENLIDTTAYGVGAIGGLFSDDFKDDVGEFIAKDLLHAKEVSEAVVKYGTVEGLFNLAANDGDTESASVLGDKSDGTVQSAAHLVGQAALQYVGVPWYVTAGVNSFGGEIESALNEDATYAEAGISGAVTTGAELLTEKLFGAFKFQGKAADDLVIDNITKNISNKVVKSLVKFGWDATGEGAEEVLSGAISAVGQKLTYADEKEWNELYTSEEAWDSFIGGAVLGGGGSAINITKNASAGRDAVTGLTENEQTVLDKEVERLVAEAEKDGTKLTNKEKNEIYEKVQEDLKKGYISTDTIESVLGGDTYKSYKDTIDSEDAILKEYEELGKKKNATLAEQSRYAELKEKVKEIESNSKRSQLKSQLSEEVYNSLSRQDGKRIQTDDFLIESYNEKARSGQAFDVDLSKYEGKEKETLQKLMEKGQVNNTRRAHEFWEYAAKVAADRGRGITSTTTEEILKMETEKHGAEYVEQNFKGKIPNGYIMENGDIAINVNSPNARRFILGHEIGHQMETADNYGELKDLLYAYAESKEGKDTFNKRKADIESIYGGIEGADADVELTNDLIGEYLYNDADFVYHLSTKNRNLFRKIWDEVKYLYKMATAGSQEQRDLLRIQKTFEKAYRESAKTESKAKGKTDYSLSLVDPVMPTTEGWQRTHTTEEVKEQFPDLWDVSADESEVRNPTQISGTVRSYRKVFEHLKAEGFDGTILDASSGLGYGTRAGIEEYGFDVEDIEPYPDKSYNPKYTDYSTLDKKYDVVISNAVLNVLPQDQRDALVVKMGEMLNDGGRIFINVRGDDVKNASSKVAINEDLMEYYISQSGSYQKGFTPDELKAYLEDTLGAEFTVEKTRMFGKVSAIVTKNGTTKYSLSPEQQEYFKDSVVRDENGDLKVMYHGTSKGGHTVFDTFGSNYGLFGQGSYFTDDKSVAESYTKKGKGNNPQVYESYLNITNPMDMDAEADIKAWMKAVPDADFSGCVTNEDCYRAMEEYLMDEEYSKWEAAEFATDSIMGMGYDGITHIGGGRFNKADDTRHRVYIAFNPEQIKNIDNVKPTDNPDIRYSLSNETDKTYLDAVERGDTDTVQRMVDEAASEAGYKKLFYHGTASGDFTKFASHGKPMWITEHKDYAEVYANTKRGTGYAEDRKVMPLYAKMDNVLDLSQIDTMNRIFQFNAPSDSLENLADIVGVNTSELTKICKGTQFEELWELVNTKQFADIARKKGYDAIKENEFGNITYGVLDNTQLKSADAVTYKKNKVIPLSERFNTENDDIRYSLTQDSEGTKLTAEQSDFFKGTKALDSNGNLLKVYHTTNNDFTVFDKSKKGEATGDSNTYLGFFFADDSEYIQNFPEFENGKTEAYYLNMTNPIDMTNISKEAFLDVVEVLGGDVNEAAEIYDQELADERDRATLRGDNNTSLSLIRLLDEMTGDADYRTFIEELKPRYDELMSKGYDGVVNYLDELFGAKEYIVLDSNQAKLATNKKPTTDADIRYSLSEGDDTYSRIYEMQIEVNNLRKTISEFETSADFKLQMNKLSEAINNDDVVNGMKEYQRWREESGYAALIDKKDALQVELDNLRKEFNDNIANRELEKERDAIAKSGLSEADYFRTQAVKEFGYTPYFYDAGYITPNGKMLNFSGEKGKHYGTRGQDHRAIGVIYAETEGTAALNRFVNDGNIRIMAETPGIDLSSAVEPTNEQYATIKRFVREHGSRGYFAVDFSNQEGRNVGNYEYEGKVNADRVVNDIKHYYQTGEVREQSSVAAFLSLSKEGGAPISFSDDVPMSDLRIKPTAEDIAPVQEVVAENTTTTKDFAPITEEEANAMQRENLASLDDADAPPEMDAPYYESEAVAPSDPFAERDIKDVGDRKVKAYMYENPEVKPFFQAEANVMLGELRDTVKGERWYNDEVYYETNGEAGFGGTSRHTTADIAYLLDDLGYTYAEIEEGLNAIIEDNGKENNACSKRIEFILNDRLMNGYPDLSGYDIPANQDYINLLNEKQITEYSEEARKKFFESVGASDIAPLAAESDIAPTREYEAIKPRPEKLEGEEAQWAKNKMARVDKPTEEQQTAQILAEEPETTKKKSRGWSKFKANFLDKGAVFEDLSLKTKNRKLMAKWNHTLSSESRAQWMIGKGRNGVKSLNAIREEVEKTGLTKQFYEYLYHKHNIDRMNLENRYEDVENKPVFGYDVTAEKSQEIVNQYEFAEPEFKEYAKDVYDYMNYLRKQLVDNGVISQETADLWAKMYPHYVPIRRVGDSGLNINVPLDTGRTGVNAPIKKATGGSRDILPLFDTMAMRTEQTFKAIARNSFGVELKNTLGSTIESNATSLDEMIDSIDKHEELLQKGENGRNPTFTVFENGEKVTFEITEDMYDALKPTGEGLKYTNKVANTVSNVHRGLLTEYNPVFTATNAIKDVQDVFLNSKHATKTYANMPRAIKELSTKGKWYTEYMENGGEQNTYFDGKTNTFKAEDNGIKKAIGMPLRAISAVNNFVERAPRLAEYIASRESGASVEEAMLDAARVTTNFAAGGDVTKFLNRNGATFLNASVQGAMQQVRNVREAKANGLKGWVQLATKFAVVGLGSELLNHLLWEDDEEYEELSDYVKQNYYVIAKYGDGQFVRIPKGRAIAVIQNAFEQVGNALTGDDEVDLKSFLELAVSNLAPNNPVEDNILAPIIQVANNETWYGEDLVPTRLQDLPAEEQFDESTDAFSKWLGETTGTSPIKWNYLLNQYSGGIGDVVLPMLTPEAESGDNSIFGNITAPLKDKFTTNSTMNNQNVSDFYDTMDELTINAKASTATDEDVLKYKYFNSVNSELGELYALKREVQNSDLPDDRKYDKVFAIQEQINALAKESLGTYNDVYIEDGYASVGDRYYKQNDDGEWQKITDDQLEKQNDVMDELGISASDYWSNKTEYDFAAKYPEKYSVAKSVGGYDSYKQYMSDLYDIKADKDEYGKSISGSRKEKVIDYINNLDADYGEKIILFKSEYKADDTYNYEIIEYLNGREDISYEEMVAILKELGFNVSSDGNVTWD